MRAPPAAHRFRCAVRACVLGLGFPLRPASPWGVLGCVCARAPVPRGLLHLLVGGAVRGCVLVGVPRLFPAIPGRGVLCERGCLARVSLCPALLGRVIRVCFFFRLLAVPLPGLVVPVPRSLSFGVGCWFFFLLRGVFLCVLGVPFSSGPLFLAWWCQFWRGGPSVPLWGSCLSVSSRWGVRPSLVVLAGSVVAVGSSLAPPPHAPCFSLGGVCPFLPLPSLGWRTHWPAFSVVFRVAVGGCVPFGRVPAPRVGWVMYTLGSAPLPAWLGPGSAGLAGAPGGFVWLRVRELGLSVSVLLRGAGFKLLGGPPAWLPGVRWPRVWSAVSVCGVLVRHLLGCAVACFGYSFRLGSAVLCCAALCRVASRCAVACCALGCVVVARCTVARCGAVCRAVPCCAVLGRWMSAWPVPWCRVRVAVWLAGGWGVRLGVGGSLVPCCGGPGVPLGLVGRVGLRGVALPGGLCLGPVSSLGPGP